MKTQKVWRQPRMSYPNQLRRRNKQLVLIYEKTFENRKMGDIEELSNFFIDPYTRSILKPGLIFWALYKNEEIEKWVKLQYIGFVKYNR